MKKPLQKTKGEKKKKSFLLSEETSQIASNEPHAPLPPAAPASLPPPPLSAAPAIARKDSLQIWDKLIRGLIYACVFLLPLIFTPWTFEVLELSKQMLLYVLVSSAAVLWLLKLLVTRNWRFVKTSLDLPILALLAVYLLASIFSVDRISSFLGPYGIFSGNFFELLFLVIFYYLVVNNFDSPSQLKKLFSFFFASVFLALVYAVLQFSGWFVLRAPFAKTGSFNTIGTLISATLIAAFAIVLSLGFKSKSIFRFPNGKLWRFLLGIAAFVILLTINFFYAWVVPLALGFAVPSFLVLQTIFQKSFRNVYKFELPLQLRLDYSTALPAIKGAVFDKPILGSGPGTFNYVFSQYRDQAFNLSQFWTVRFDKAPSEAVEYLTGTGILGFLVFEVFNLLFIAYAIMFLLQNREQSFWAMGLALLSGYAVLWVSHWFLFFNTFMAFSSWFTIAVFMTLSRFASKEQIKSYDFSFATSP